MTSYDPSPPIDILRWGDLGKSVADNENLPPISIVSSFDLESFRSRPQITKNASMNSFSTQWSTATAQISNTTTQQSKKKRRKRKFLHFVKILLRIVREKDEGKFRNAKAVVCNWERQQHEDGIESFSESLCCPLKEAVGARFWSEARERMSLASAQEKIKRYSFCTPAASDADSSNRTVPLRHGEECCVHSYMEQLSKQETYAKHHLTTDEIKDLRTRKKRLWMVIRVFLKYLRNKHQHLYRQAHTLVNECVRQHRQDRDSKIRKSLSGSIEACLKNEFGSELWTRAEDFVAQAFRVRPENRWLQK